MNAPESFEHEAAIEPDQLVGALAEKGRAAQRMLAQASDEAKAAALREAARALREASSAILRANADDMAAAEERDLTGAMLDRLRLDTDRLEAMAAGVATVASLADPVGSVIDESVPPNGLKLSRVRVPIGLIGIVYESRPNVTADAAALCVRSGNAALLRGGSEAVRSNRAIHAAFAKGLTRGGLPGDSAQLVPTQDRAVVGAMLTAAGLIDMVVPRGGRSLVERVQADARVPVLAHLDGLCHTYLHAAADAAMARDIAVNAKMRRTGICGAMETLLLDSGFAGAQEVISGLLEAGCELRGDGRARALDPRISEALEDDWDTEYLAPVLSVAVVDGVEHAMQHIARHGSNHTDAIVTSDDEAAAQFLNGVDSAIVMHNASTQYADGGEFGLGAEIGIATGRLHARGPVALEGLTTYKWLVRGEGQARP